MAELKIKAIRRLKENAQINMILQMLYQIRMLATQHLVVHKVIRPLVNVNAKQQIFFVHI